MDFKFGVLLIVGAQICTTLALPPCVCPKNLAPVCGSNGVTYSNKCRLECDALTLRTIITEDKQGPCEGSLPQVFLPDACICTYDYKPVCGTDGQTYPNECSLGCQKSRSNASLAVKSTGACVTPTEPVSVCPLIENPVCGTDGITYGNDCMLNAATKDKAGLGVAHQGACADRVIVKDI